MKKINSILISAVSLLAFAPVAGAQSIQDVLGNLDFDVKDTKVEGGVGFNKTVASPTSEGIYWIKLEAFSTGQAISTVSSKPSDIILVLDYSTSMTESYGTLAYTAQASTEYNYSSYTSGLYYLDNGNYYEVYADSRASGGPWGGGTRYYYLYYRVGNSNNSYRYLTSSGVIQGGSNDYPTTVTDPDATIWTGVLYKQTGGGSRLDALKSACQAFVTTIYNNDAKARAIDSSYAGDRVAVVSFNSSATTRYDLTPINTGYNTLYSYFGGSGIGTGTYTNPGDGLDEASDQWRNSSGNATLDPERNRVVVLFTDGCPSYHQSYVFDSDYAAAAVNNATTLKNDFGASVYTIGLFDTSNNYWNTLKEPTIDYMNFLSSNFTGVSAACNNYPNNPSSSNPSVNGSVTYSITGFDPWTEARSDDAYADQADALAGDSEFFFMASDDPSSLEAIFEHVAKQSGGSADESLSSATSTVDIVSSSFLLPENATADSIKLFTAKCTSYDAETNTYGFATEILAPERAVNVNDTSSYYKIYDEHGDLVEIDGVTMFDVDDNMSVSLGKDADGNDKITVDGFDYSNLWCGPVKDENGNVTSINGFKVIILIPVEMNPDAVGGPNVATNAAGSGIYIDPDDDEPHVTFDSPTVSLPVNVHISKKGLNSGESAKFMIYRAQIPVDANGKELENWDPKNIEEADWEYVSSIFVTNSPNAKRDTSNNPMVKVRGMPATVQVGTDPVTGKPIQRGVVYRITEESWSWSYEEDPEAETSGPQYTVTSKVDNPFLFENKKKKDIEMKVRHAESKATNIFKATADGGGVKYDDSKPRSTTSKSK